MSNNGFQQSAYSKYSVSNNVDVEMGNDVVKTGNIFLSDPKKHEELKMMLESNKDSAKLEAMKRIISMVAKGKDCGDMFPAVVKNVVSKNAEVKKLVYAYLTRYAEEQQDLALLSISTFQRALKDPNQLIRGCALRVLSSIRVPMIVPIMMLSIKECVMDMSPYVRKIAAHAIPKMYSLDPATKEQLIEVIEKLLGDKTTLVAGSAIQAFEEVCPERLDLVHKHYRKLCNLLIDVEEWGQIVIINMLTRYARTQFLDPNLIKKLSTIRPHKKDTITGDTNFYSDEDNVSTDEDDEDSDDSGGHKKRSGKRPQINRTMDPDHRLLLNCVKPLLQSRNSAVVMSVVQLYYHCAPSVEMNTVIRALIRLLKCNREVQYVVLNNVASMSISRPELLQSHIKSFFVYNSDSSQVKLLKLEILTNLANEVNISIILRELQSYVSNTDQEFVKATIQAIGRCASNIAEVSDNCLAGLVQLISRKDENIVAEAVVVIRKLLQMQSCDHRDIIVSLAVLLDNINVPMAKASIIWLIGEYCDRVPKLAPDVLRKAAKTFVDEKDIVKLQTINLASKLYITNPRQSHLLVQYVLNLAKYDVNYDIRDRARFIRALLFPPVVATAPTTDNTCGEEEAGEEAATPATEEPQPQNNGIAAVSFLTKKVKKIFLATKPAPLLESNFKDRQRLQLGSLSHLLSHRLPGYRDLPDWPDVAPDTALRHVREESPADCSSGGRGGLLAVEELPDKKSTKKGRKDDFYSGEESETGSSSEEDSDDDDEENENSEESEENTDEEENPENKKADVSKPSIGLLHLADKTAKTSTKEPSKSVGPPVISRKIQSSTEEEDDDSTESESSEEEDDDDSGSGSSSSIEVPVKKAPAPTAKKTDKTTKKSTKKSTAPEVDLLLDFDDVAAPAVSATTAPQVLSLPAQMLLQPSVLDQPLQHDFSPTTPQEEIYIPGDVAVRKLDILARYSSEYIQVVAEFPRSLSRSSLTNPRLVYVRLVITNVCSDGTTLHNLRILESSSSSSTNAPVIDLSDFQKIDDLLAQKSITGSVGLDFRDSCTPVPLTVAFSTFLEAATDGSIEEASSVIRQQEKRIEVRVTASIGELLQPISMTTKEFQSQQKSLRGMHEAKQRVSLAPVSRPILFTERMRQLARAVFETANITTVTSSADEGSVWLRLAGVWSGSRLPCLVELVVTGDTEVDIAVHSEALTLIGQLAKDVAAAISGLS